MMKVNSLVVILILVTLIYCCSSVATTGSTIVSPSSTKAALADEDQGGTMAPNGGYNVDNSAMASFFGFQRRPDLLDRIGGSESNENLKFAVIYVHSTELLINGAGFPDAFTSFIESALKNQEVSPFQKIAIVVGGCEGDGMKVRKAEIALKRVLREIVESFGDSSMNKRGSSFASSFHRDSDENLTSDLKAFFEDTEDANISSPPELSSAYTRSMPTGQVDVSGGKDLTSVEIDSMRKYVNVVDQFVSTFVSTLHRGGEEVRRILKIADIIAALEAASASINSNDKSIDYTGSRVATNSLAIIKHRVWSVVYPIYRKSIDSVYHDALLQFEKESKNVPANTMLKRNLKVKVDECVRTFAKEAKVLRKEFAAALSRIDSLHKTEEGAKTGTGRISSTHWVSMDYSADAIRLADDLSRKCTDKVRNLWLQGIYNPYIRGAPWAPTHINLNYLIDPQAVMFDFQYGQLYDPHEDKITINRADPITLPGMAKLVFDPNKHPVPQEEKPWWVTLKEFYFSD